MKKIQLFSFILRLLSCIFLLTENVIFFENLMMLNDENIKCIFSSTKEFIFNERRKLLFATVFKIKFGFLI